MTENDTNLNSEKIEDGQTNSKTEVKEQKRKKDKVDNLDTETTFADMNIEGFRWYDPQLKKTGKRDRIKVTKKEYWSMVKGAFLAYLPMIAGVVVAFGLMFVIAWLWLL